MRKKISYRKKNLKTYHDKTPQNKPHITYPKPRSYLQYIYQYMYTVLLSFHFFQKKKQAPPPPMLLPLIRRFEIATIRFGRMRRASEKKKYPRRVTHTHTCTREMHGARASRFFNWKNVYIHTLHLWWTKKKKKKQTLPATFLRKERDLAN